jgi:CelD/BcsL family acetyltransferase involved in cellulose biosynthesis
MEARSHPTQHRRLDAAVLRDDEGFAALEGEWAELYERCPSATPFQSWAWLYSWWEHHGEGYELRLVTLREGGLLVGLLPLMLERRFAFGRLLFIGSGTTDYLDMLAREGRESVIAEAGVTALEQMGGWRVADLQELRPEAAAWGLCHGWEGPWTRLWQSNCPMMDVRPWDELLASLSRNHRSTVRRTLSRMEADGVRCELAGPTDAEEAAVRWLALHQEAWKERNIAPEHLDEGFEAHLEAAVRRMTARGLGSVSESWRDGEVVASQFLLFGQDFIGQHLFGATQEALRRYQVSSLYIWDAMNVARSKNVPCVNYLRGEEPYKLRWSSRVVPNHRLVLGRDRLSCALYAGYQDLRSKAEWYVYSEGAPEWVKQAVTLRRILRRRMRAKSVEGKEP